MRSIRRTVSPYGSEPASRTSFTLAIVDPAAGTDNVGDEFIVEAAARFLAGLFPHARLLRVPTHHPIGPLGRGMLDQSALRVLAGSNILPSHIATQTQWAVRERDAPALSGLTCMGVGWQKTDPPDAATVAFLKQVLDPARIHSAREPMTAERLAALGFRALMTGCPSMWSLTPDHCAAIPSTRAEDVVLTLSTGVMDEALDGALVALLRRRYRRIWYFPQHWGDLTALLPHGWEQISPVPPRRDAYDALLRSSAVDYVGLRLHGGVRALQHRRRALILPVDHRATGMAEGTGLPIAAREDIDGIEAWIDGDRPTRITLPSAAIAAWHSQFRDWTPVARLTL